MTLNLPVGYANTRFRFSLSGIVDEMSFSVACGPQADFGPADIAADMDTAFTSTDLNDPTVMFTGWTYLGVATTLMTGTGPMHEIRGNVIVGTASGSTPPPNCSLLVAKRTNTGGRSGRGRLYQPICNISETNITSQGDLLGATYAGFVGLYDAFYDAIIAAGRAPCLLHSNPLATPSPIVAFEVQQRIATQRRRLR